MPGIVGLITKKPRAVAEQELLRMEQTLLHEPFYASGTWIDESLGVFVGWSAQKGSFADEMPLLNEKGDLVLVFAGENFPEPGTERDWQRVGSAPVPPKRPTWCTYVRRTQPFPLA